MPNHTSNALTTNNPELIAIFHECQRNGEEDIIDVTVPMPKALRGITTGSATGPDGSTIHAWRNSENGEIEPVSAAELALLSDTYGTYDWYDWASNQWGTKWGSYNTEYDFFRGAATVKFDTAWAPPEKWLKTLMEAYPQGQTRMAYAEGGMEFYGVITYVDGVLVEHEHVDGNFWVEDVDWDTIEDSMDALTPGARDHLTTYGLHTGG